MTKKNTWYGAPSRKSYLDRFAKVFTPAEAHDDRAAELLARLDLRALMADPFLIGEVQALAYLAAVGPLPATMRLLAQAGVPLDGAEEGVPLLHYACAVGSSDVVEAILAAGVPVDQRDPVGKTALHIAAIFGHTAVARALIAAGADLTVRGEDGRTPAQDAREAADRQAMQMEYDLRAGLWTIEEADFQGFQLGDPDTVADVLDALTGPAPAGPGLHGLASRRADPAL